MTRAVPAGAPTEMADGWAVARPDQQGLDPTLLGAIGPRLEAWKAAIPHGVVVARHGRLVYERYFTGEDWRWAEPIGTVAYDAETKHDIRSITKSVTALLFGAALERGWVRDVASPVFDFFPEHAGLRTPQNAPITLAHLLTMSAGFAWDESLPYSDPANSERQLGDAPDLYRYVLERPLATEPGRLWNYCGGATTLLQGVIQRTSGRRLEEIAQEILFEPLGIKDWDWMRFPSGDAIGLGGLRLRPRDLAKIGQLVLDRGSWKGEPIIPAAWIAQSTTPQIQGEGIFFYGYHWWLGRSLLARHEVTWAAGFGNGGQRLYVVPAAGIVVAVTAGAYNQMSPLGGAVLNQYVLPAILD